MDQAGEEVTQSLVIACICRGVAQLGSAPLWGSGGRGFKSRRSDLITGLDLSRTAVHSN